MTTAEFDQMMGAMILRAADGKRIATKAEVWREWWARENVRAFRRLVEAGVIRLRGNQ
jgi:hypothetical protein